MKVLRFSKSEEALELHSQGRAACIPFLFPRKKKRQRQRQGTCILSSLMLRLLSVIVSAYTCGWSARFPWSGVGEKTLRGPSALHDPARWWPLLVEETSTQRERSETHTGVLGKVIFKQFSQGSEQLDLNCACGVGTLFLGAVCAAPSHC